MCLRLFVCWFVGCVALMAQTSCKAGHFKKRH